MSNKTAKRLGIFIGEAKSTTLLRTYEIGNKPVRIELGRGVDTVFADKVVPVIASKKVRFENDSARRNFDKLGDFIPASIHQGFLGNKGEYEMYFSQPTMRILSLESIRMKWL